MTYLPAVVMGRWYDLHLILGLYSRKIVGREVHDTDDSAYATRLVKRKALAEGITAMASKPFLHRDNGVTLKATMVVAMRNPAECDCVIKAHLGKVVQPMAAQMRRQLP
jgi:hypothetical protein